MIKREEVACIHQAPLTLMVLKKKKKKEEEKIEEEGENGGLRVIVLRLLKVKS